MLTKQYVEELFRPLGNIKVIPYYEVIDYGYLANFGPGTYTKIAPSGNFFFVQIIFNIFEQNLADAQFQIYVDYTLFPELSKYAANQNVDAVYDLINIAYQATVPTAIIPSMFTSPSGFLMGTTYNAESNNPATGFVIITGWQIQKL